MYVNQITIHKVYNRLINNLFSHFHRCPLCHQDVEQQAPVCDTCLQRLQPVDGPVCHCCLPCAEADAGKFCGRCIKRPPLFTDCRCSWHYQFPLDHLVNRYKHHGSLDIEPLLVSIWLLALAPLPAGINALVPIPVHWYRFGQRGFNQAARLGRQLADQLDLPFLAALEAPYRTPMLQGKAASERRKIMRHQFKVVNDVKGMHLVLIDDVMTTGSTANEASRTLLEAGADRVDVWALCRVPARP